MDEIAEIRVQMVQGYLVESCDDMASLMIESIDELNDDITDFVLENQDTIHLLYKKLKTDKLTLGSMTLEHVADTDKVLQDYLSYHDAMLGYIKECVSKGVDGTEANGLNMALENMREKDCIFLENELEYVSECAPDAMRDFETLIDLKKLLSRIKEEGENILSLQGDMKTKEDFYSLYTKSTLTFCIKLLGIIKDVFTQVCEGILSPPKPVPPKDYVMF